MFDFPGMTTFFHDESEQSLKDELKKIEPVEI